MAPLPLLLSHRATVRSRRRTALRRGVAVGLGVASVVVPLLATGPVAGAAAAAPDDTPTDEAAAPTTSVVERTVDATMVVVGDMQELHELLLATYRWDERSLRVASLQQRLGVTADGWYSHQTRQAHLAALAWTALPTAGVPAVPVDLGPDAAAWAALRECESGGDYAIVNRTGTYRGAYQFDRPTWDDVARRHHPHLVGVDPAAASPADQDAMARSLYSMRGARPWPVCGRHLG